MVVTDNSVGNFLISPSESDTFVSNTPPSRHVVWLLGRRLGYQLVYRSITIQLRFNNNLNSRYHKFAKPFRPNVPEPKNSVFFKSLGLDQISFRHKVLFLPA